MPLPVFSEDGRSVHSGTEMRSNRNAFRHLHEAYRAFKKKNFTKALIILESARDSGREDHYSLFLQALCLLYSNNFSGANTVIEKIQRISPSYTPFIQLKSFLALKSSTSREGAIQAYISALEKNPSDRLLRSGLKHVEEAQDFGKYQKEAKISDLVYVPGPGGKDKTGDLFSIKERIGAGRIRRLRVKPFIFYLFFTVIILLMAVTVTYIIRGGHYFSRDKNAVNLDRDSLTRIDMVDISGSNFGLINRISQDKTPEFYASGDVLINDFTEARMLVKKGLFNRALLILNKIINSNASYPVKEKSDFLVRFIMDSPERVYEEIKLKEINARPWLYRGSAVKISGRTANVKESRNGMSFSIMVDYDGNTFKGVCDVFSAVTLNISNGDTVEVLGIYIFNTGNRAAPYISAEKVMVITSSKN